MNVLLFGNILVMKNKFSKNTTTTKTTTTTISTIDRHTQTNKTCYLVTRAQCTVEQLGHTVASQDFEKSF